MKACFCAYLFLEPSPPGSAFQWNPLLVEDQPIPVPVPGAPPGRASRLHVQPEWIFSSVCVGPPQLVQSTNKQWNKFDLFVWPACRSPSITWFPWGIDSVSLWRKPSSPVTKHRSKKSQFDLSAAFLQLCRNNLMQKYFTEIFYRNILQKYFTKEIFYRNILLQKCFREIFYYRNILQKYFTTEIVLCRHFFAL